MMGTWGLGKKFVAKRFLLFRGDILWIAIYLNKQSTVVERFPLFREFVKRGSAVPEFELSQPQV